jgi:hypothetical protein
VKDEIGDMLAYIHFSQLLNVQNVSDARQIETCTTEPLVPGSSCLESEIANAKLKKYKFPDREKIPAELNQAGGETLLSAVRKLISSLWDKKELLDQWKGSIIVPIQKKSDKTVIIIMGYHCHQLHTKFYSISFFQG